MPTPLSGSLLRDLRSAVGADWVITDPDRLLVYEADAQGKHQEPPQAVVLPRSTEEVARVVRLLGSCAVPVVPRGAGTGLAGGAVAAGGGVVIGFSRMKRILHLDPEERVALVEAGVVNSELSAAAGRYGLHYAPDPSSQTACTIGGNVAENSGGPHCLKYGVTSRYVRGIRVVLGDGNVVWLGGRAREEPGLDLVGLVIGSEGCLGLVTEVEVELLPVPEAVRTLLGIFETPEAAGEAVTRILAGGLLPAALEIVDRHTIEAVEASIYAAGYPTDAGAALVVEFDGIEAGIEAELSRAAKCCVEAGAREVRRAGDEAERQALWRGRKKAFGAMGRLGRDLLVQDATVPRTRLPQALARIEEIAARYRLRVANVFHAGDGNLHPNIVFDRRNPDEAARVEAASREIMETCVAMGGTITGEHGVGLDKRDYMPMVFGPQEMEALHSVKRAFDPNGILNPGKVLPPGGFR